MNSDHLVQMKNLRFPPDLPKFPERKVSCGDPAANNLKEGKHFSLYFLICLEIVWYSQELFKLQLPVLKIYQYMTGQLPNFLKPLDMVITVLLYYMYFQSDRYEQMNYFKISFSITFPRFNGIFKHLQHFLLVSYLSSSL